MTIWVLGDQLTREVGPLAAADPETDRVLLVEAYEFARRLPYHAQKLVVVFSAIRHFREELRDAGFTVEYRRADTFREALADHFAEHPDDRLRVMEPASHGAGERLREVVADAARDAGVTADTDRLELAENDLFLCSPSEFDERFPDAIPRQETFYRWMRRRTGYLMTDEHADSGEAGREDAEKATTDPEPVGGEWNYDDANREVPPDGYEFPDPPTFELDGTTAEVAAWVESAFDTWGASVDDESDAVGDSLHWPVTRDQALDALDQFVTERLPEFGPYQDAMVTDSWSGNHALLSPAINLGLLHPTEVIERAIAAFESDDGPAVPIESVEGFVRQVLGWREFVRHAYRREMPAMASANALDATRDLPPLYYDADTEMACLDTVVGRVWDRGYSHHIERLMILSNFALLYGADPHELNRWFHLAYVDAYHWVTTPNVVGMGSFATDALSTKPYAASANYVDRMSDFCAGCRYDPDETTGEDACPFNALYWDFLAANEDALRGTHRMNFQYHNLDRKDEERLAEIRERAAAVRDAAADGDL